MFTRGCTTVSIRLCEYTTLGAARLGRCRTKCAAADAADADAGRTTSGARCVRDVCTYGCTRTRLLLMCLRQCVSARVRNGVHGVSQPDLVLTERRCVGGVCVCACVRVCVRVIVCVCACARSSSTITTTCTRCRSQTNNGPSAERTQQLRAMRRQRRRRRSAVGNGWRAGRARARAG